MNYNRPYKSMADQVASRGRYGDTTLMHVNPAEVEGLASLTPLTVNPDTGYPEAFLPFLAPILGSLGGTALATSGALGALSPLATSGIAALGSGLATTAVTGSLEEGLLAGLTGFGIGQVAQGANLTGHLAEAGAAQGIGPDQLGNISAEWVPAVTNAAGDVTTQAGMQLTGKGLEGLTGVQTDALLEAVKKPGMGGMFTEAGMKGAGSALMNPANLAPIGVGMGGIAVEEDYKDYVEGMENAEQARKDKRAADKAAYVEQIPGRVALNPTGPTTRTAGGSGPTGLGGPYAGRYGNEGGAVRRFNTGGINPGHYGAGNNPYLEANGWSYDSNTGIWSGPNGATFQDPYWRKSGDGADAGGDGGDGATEETGYQYEGEPGQFRPPTEVGATPPRGYNATPSTYMPGFMPEWQYLTNLSPSATDIRGNPALSGGVGGTYDTPMGRIEVPDNPGGVAGEIDPTKRDLSVNPYAYGSDWNEFLMGNEEIGRSSYMDEYMANMPYYQYADQSFDDIFGGGGYGTPSFTGYRDPIMGGPPPVFYPTDTQPQPNPYEEQIASLNARIDELLAQIEGKTTETETTEDENENKEDKEDKGDKEPKWVLTGSYTNDDGNLVKTFTDENPNSPTFGETKTEQEVAESNKTPIWEVKTSVRVDNGQMLVTSIDTNPYSPTYNQEKQEYTGEITHEQDENGNWVPISSDDDEDKNTEPDWQQTGSVTLDDGRTEITKTDQNPDSPTFGDTTTEIVGEATHELVNGEWVLIGSSTEKTVVNTVSNPDGTSTVYYSDGTEEIQGTPTHELVDGQWVPIGTSSSSSSSDNTSSSTASTDSSSETTTTVDGDTNGDGIVTIEDYAGTNIDLSSVGGGSFTIPDTSGLTGGNITTTLPGGAGTDTITNNTTANTTDNTTTNTTNNTVQPYNNPYGINFNPYGAGFNFGNIGWAEGGTVNRYQEGGPSLATIEDYAQPLPQGRMQQPMSNPKVEQLVSSFEDVAEQKGQPLSEGDKDLLRKTSSVILGEIQDDGTIVSQFVALFGSEQLDNLKAYLNPEAEQTKGMIEGEGGGMDDRVSGTLGEEQVALSPGEYIVTADVVSDLGDGNNEKGAEIMDDFMQRVRYAKHGSSKQPDPINLDEVMPA